ncbi:MAG: hypothetical protein WBH04_10240 [Albidovulum sp.]
MKKQRIISALLVATLVFPATAWADCTVKYKAKQDNPLRLQAGSATLPDAACASKAKAAAALAADLKDKGWTLLAITAIVPSN